MTAPTGHAGQRRQRGLALYREIMATDPPEPVTPRVAALIDFVFAEIWSRPGLGRRDRRLIALSCAASTGADETVADHLYAALTTGEFDVAELEEFVLQFAVYCGWPKAEALERILNDQRHRVFAPRNHRPRRSTADWGSDRLTREARGEQEFHAVNGFEAPPRGTPYYDVGILDFVYGEVWTRPGLSRRDRRLISLACAGCASASGPVLSHVISAMTSGDLTHAAMLEVVLQFAAHAGWPRAQLLQQAVDEMHSSTVELVRS